MAEPSTPPTRPRLSRDRVIDAAIDLADADGAGALTIRALAARLGVKPMAIYHHVANKDAILDGIVERVFEQVDIPVPGQPWRRELEGRARSLRALLVRHPWALALLESRTSPGPATLTHHDAQLGTLREGGFTVAAAGHAIALLDAFVYGFVLQEVTLPFDGAEEIPDLAHDVLGEIPDGAFPYLVEFARERVLQPGYDFAAEFDVGLALVLDAIATLGGARPRR